MGPTAEKITNKRPSFLALLNSCSPNQPLSSDLIPFSLSQPAIYIRNRRYRVAQQLHQTQLHLGRILATVRVDASSDPPSGFSRHHRNLLPSQGGPLPTSGGLDEARKAAFPTMTHAEAVAMPKTTQLDTQ